MRYTGKYNRNTRRVGGNRYYSYRAVYSLKKTYTQASFRIELVIHVSELCRVIGLEYLPTLLVVLNHCTGVLVL